MSEELVAPTASSTVWRRVHRATPFIKAWQVIAITISFVTATQIKQLIELFKELEAVIWLAFLILLGLLAGLLLISTLYAWLAWKRIRYALTDEALYLHKGIVFRSQRHARLSRIQGVEVRRTLFGRLVGLAAVVVESAGGANSRVTIEYLTEAAAEALRAEVLARAAGLVALESAAGEVPVFAEAPERKIFELAPSLQLRSLVRQFSTILTVAAVAGTVAWSIAIREFAILLALLPVLTVFGSLLWTEFAGNFAHSLAISPDGLRMRSGLLSTRSQTIPPGRVQAIELTQPLLWRKHDWWRIKLNVAGYVSIEATGQGAKAGAVMLPVAPREVTLRALWLLVPSLGAEGEESEKELLEAGLTGVLADGGFLHAPPAARWVDWVARKRHGALATGTVLLLRRGRFRRALVLVPHERTQSLGISQGPLQRALGVATFQAHSVLGPIQPRAKHLPVGDCLRLLEDQAARARVARTKEGPEQWARRVGLEAE